MKQVFFLFLFLPLISFGQKSFKYYTFEKQDRFVLLGDAEIIDEDVRLTRADEWLTGAVWYKNKVKVEEGFEVVFSMLMSQHGGWGGKGADGIAFVISNDPKGYTSGEPGEGIGYEGMKNCLAVEFDTFDNQEGGDNHVSIQTNGKHKVSRHNDHSLAINHKIPELQSVIRQVKITYDFKFMRVFIDEVLYIKKEVHLEKIIKLDQGKAYIGFTASTAGAYSQHKILDWSWQMGTKDLVYRTKSEAVYIATILTIPLNALIPKEEFWS